MPVLNNLALTSYNFGINNGAASTVAPELVFNKARSLSGAPVVSGDRLGRIYFGGADSGGTLSTKLGIEALSVGTIGVDRIPFNLNFYTAQNAALAPQILRMVIANDGVVSISKADSDTQTIGTPVTTFAVIGSSLIAANDRVSTDGALAAFLKNRAGGTIVSGDTIGSLSWIATSGSGEQEAARISANSAGTVATRVPGQLRFWTKPDSASPLKERVVIDENGLVAIDKADNDTGIFGSPKGSFGVFGTSSVSVNETLDANGGYSSIIKTRALSTITSGDILGTFGFEGADTPLTTSPGALIRSVSSGTIGAGRIPANLSFWTKPDSATTITERMVISSAGNVTVNAPDAGTALTVTGSLDIESIENVFGVTPAGATEMVIINAAGELGSQAIPGSALTYTAVNTSPYTVLAGDQFIGVDCSGGAITIRLPNAPTTGRYITIKDSTGSASANTITVTTVGGVVTIDGATSYLMTADYESVSVLFNGSSYEIY